MKQIIKILFCLVLVFLFTRKEETILIPQDSIRFRVIANSNSTEDQQQKMEIKDVVEKEINTFIMQATNIEEARTLLQKDMKKIEKLIENYNVDYEMNYGMNYFPEKEYKGITYEEGEYESLVITLGSGSGTNWWCVMFPPLCLLDAQENELEEVQYKSFVKTILEQYME